MKKIIKEMTANKTPRTIVPLKSVFSNPLRVCRPESTLSPPPSAPIPAAELCRRIAITRMTERII